MNTFNNKLKKYFYSELARNTLTKNTVNNILDLQKPMEFTNSV